jgi:hypothetical protein
MNKKIVTQFTILTFIIMAIAWGVCVICGQFGITKSNHAWLNIPYILGGFSPTIASYLVLKRNNKVTGLKEWFKNIFTFKSGVLFYLLVVLFGVIYLVPQILISGVKEMSPLYMFFLNLPIMLVGGGMEEAGWRYILQPELDKKYRFILSSIIVAVIWSVWHLPLFFIPEVGQYGENFGLFAIGVLGLTFALGAIRKISGNVFLCVLFHCIANAGTTTFIFQRTLPGVAVMSGLMIIFSTIAVFAYKSQKKTHIL